MEGSGVSRSALNPRTHYYYHPQQTDEKTKGQPGFHKTTPRPHPAPGHSPACPSTFPSSSSLIPSRHPISL